MICSGIARKLNEEFEVSDDEAESLLIHDLVQVVQPPRKQKNASSKVEPSVASAVVSAGTGEAVLPNL
jgi:hypothetical protein